MFIHSGIQVVKIGERMKAVENSIEWTVLLGVVRVLVLMSTLKGLWLRGLEDQ